MKVCNQYVLNVLAYGSEIKNSVVQRAIGKSNTECASERQKGVGVNSQARSRELHTFNGIGQDSCPVSMMTDGRERFESGYRITKHFEAKEDSPLDGQTILSVPILIGWAQLGIEEDEIYYRRFMASSRRAWLIDDSDDSCITISHMVDVAYHPSVSSTFTSNDFFANIAIWNNEIMTGAYYKIGNINGLNVVPFNRFKRNMVGYRIGFMDGLFFEQLGDNTRFKEILISFTWC